MRGFRASRAVLNSKSAHFGKHIDNPHKDGGSHLNGQSDNSKAMMKLRLPEWLRMPAQSSTPARDKEPNVIPITRAKKTPAKRATATAATARKPAARATRAKKTIARKRKAA